MGAVAGRQPVHGLAEGEPQFALEDVQPFLADVDADQALLGAGGTWSRRACMARPGFPAGQYVQPPASAGGTEPPRTTGSRSGAVSPSRSETVVP